MLIGKLASMQHRAALCLYNRIIYPPRSNDLLQNSAFMQASLSLSTLDKALTLYVYSEGTSRRYDRT